MCFLICSITFVWNISHSEKNWARYEQKYILVFMYNTFYSCQILVKLEFSGRIFEKYLYQNSWKLIQWEPSCSMRTEGRTHGVRFWWNLNFLGRFSKNNRIKIHENWSSGSRVVPCGRKDGRTVSDFGETWIFWADFRKILISKFMKIGPVGAELFHADGRTDAWCQILVKLEYSGQIFEKYLYQNSW